MSRILVIGENPRLDTGQGRIGRTVANALQRAGHGVLYMAWCQSEINRQRHLDYKILFVDDYGGKAFDNIVIAERPDVVLTVGDAWNFDYINLSTVRGLFQWIAYCFSGDTDIVTKTGIKNIKEIKLGEMVLSVNPVNSEVSYQKVIDTQKIKHNGEMINIQSKKADFKISPEHRLLLKKSYKEKYEFVNANTLYENANTVRYEFPKFKPISGEKQAYYYTYKNVSKEFKIVIDKKDLNKISDICKIGNSRRHHGKNPPYTIKIKDIKDEIVFDKVIPLLTNSYIKGKKKDRSYLPLRFKMNDFLQLLGWYISEGYATTGECNRIGISQQIYKEGQREVSYRKEIEKLLTRMQIKYKSQKNALTIAGMPIVDLLTKLCGRYSKNKKIPQFVYDLDHTHLRNLYESMMKGDGFRTGYAYTTISDLLKDGFIRLCFHLGYNAYINKNNKVVTISRTRNHNAINYEHITKQKWDDNIYCLTVENNGTVLAGRNGKYQFIGQCAVDGLGYAGGIPRHHEAYLAQADYVVAYTEFGRRAIIRTMPYVVNKIDVIYHGVDDTVFKPISREDRKKIRQQLNIDDKFVCLYAGRTHFRKNVAYIMKAFNALKRAGKTDNCVLWMHTSFEDPQNYNVHRMIKEFDLDGMIYTFDQVKNMKSPIQHIEERDYNLLLNAADCLINMGGEGFGYTVAEAMMAKTAVITLGDSATGELGGRGRAILIKPCNYMTGVEITERPLVDPKELAAKILDCKGRNNTEMVNTAYEWAQENIAQRVIDKRWQQFMDRYEHPLSFPCVLEAV